MELKEGPRECPRDGESDFELVRLWAEDMELARVAALTGDWSRSAKAQMLFFFCGLGFDVVVELEPGRGGSGLSHAGGPALAAAAEKASDMLEELDRQAVDTELFTIARARGPEYRRLRSSRSDG